MLWMPMLANLIQSGLDKMRKFLNMQFKSSGDAKF